MGTNDELRGLSRQKRFDRHWAVQLIKLDGSLLTVGHLENSRLDGIPLMRQQLINFTRPLRWQARENIFQIHIRIMAVEPRRLDQAHDRRPPFSAA